jgi:hypothetical protein
MGVNSPFGRGASSRTCSSPLPYRGQSSTYRQGQRRLQENCPILKLRICASRLDGQAGGRPQHATHYFQSLQVEFLETSCQSEQPLPNHGGEKLHNVCWSKPQDAKSSVFFVSDWPELRYNGVGFDDPFSRRLPCPRTGPK